MLESFSFCGGDLALQNARMGRALLVALASSFSIPNLPQFIQFIKIRNFLGGWGQKSNASWYSMHLGMAEEGRECRQVSGTVLYYVLDTFSSSPFGVALPLPPVPKVPATPPEASVALPWRLTLLPLTIPSCIFCATHFFLSNHRLLGFFHLPHICFNPSSTSNFSVLFITPGLFLCYH